jgi:hypothetical protein
VSNEFEVLLEKAKGHNRYGYLGIDGTTVLTLIFRKMRVRLWIGLIWLEMGLAVVGSYEFGT